MPELVAGPNVIYMLILRSLPVLPILLIKKIKISNLCTTKKVFRISLASPAALHRSIELFIFIRSFRPIVQCNCAV